MLSIESRIIAVASVLAMLVLPCSAQKAKDAPQTTRSVQALVAKAAEAELDTAKKLLKDKDPAAAALALRRALLLDPTQIEAYALMVDATKHDDAVASSWRLALQRAGAANGGKSVLDGSSRRRLVPSEGHLANVSSAVSAAFDELVRVGQLRQARSASKPEDAIVAAWARRVALDLTHASPRLDDKLRLSPEIQVPASLPLQVCQALVRLAKASNANDDISMSVQALRILSGLEGQLSFARDRESLRDSELAALLRGSKSRLTQERERLAKTQEVPWTCDQLRNLEVDQADRFSRRHAHFGDPGIAISLRGRYRIETDCGYETLLGTASTIDYHHERLAWFFGMDPFENQQGLVRVVSQATGLEGEGANEFWLNGFQLGDTTCVRLRNGDSIEGLGHLLVHELTHRFDGIINPGLPGWLAEGKAEWTSGAYAHIGEKEFAMDYANLAAIQKTYYDRYNVSDRLEKLVSNNPPEYRDNYTAGHALYVYLRSWRGQDGKHLYEDALVKFQLSSAGVKDHFAHFKRHFCDGVNGRPRSFDEFSLAWGQWLLALSWRELQDRPKSWQNDLLWDMSEFSFNAQKKPEVVMRIFNKRADPINVSHYSLSENDHIVENEFVIQPGKSSEWRGAKHTMLKIETASGALGLVPAVDRDFFVQLDMDVVSMPEDLNYSAIWGWGRKRDEPMFGEGQAGLAAELLQRCGDHEGAVAAYVWSLALDGRSVADKQRLVQYLASVQRSEAAWCLQHFDAAPLRMGKALDRPVSLGLQRSLACLSAFDESVAESKAAGASLLGTLLSCDRARFANWIGAEPVSIEILPKELIGAHLRIQPFRLGASGWREEDLVGYEKFRVRGLWRETDEAHLLVGRTEALESKLSTGGGIGSVDRDAKSIHAFALAEEPVLPGSWSLTCRARFQTSFVRAAIVLGWRDRTRFHALSFQAGDYAYAKGISEKKTSDFSSLYWNFYGPWDREADSQLHIGRTFDFSRPSDNVLITIQVDGPVALIYLDGRLVGRYHDPLGEPIEGRIGFATSEGSVRFEGMSIARLERVGTASMAEVEPQRFDLTSGRSVSPFECLNMPTSGVSLAPHGTLVLYVRAPVPSTADQPKPKDPLRSYSGCIGNFAHILRQTIVSQEVVIALPAGLSDELKASLQAKLREVVGDRGITVLHHHQRFDPPKIAAPNLPGGSFQPQSSEMLCLFIDSAGAVRAVEELSNSSERPNPQAALSPGLRRWVSRYRDYAMPERELREPVR